ncbi:MAG: hypothetical protein RLO21_05235 [Nitratireductor sp.]
MSDEVKWLIGLAVGLSTFAFGAISTALYRLNSVMKANDDKIHERINRVRDDYVRRDDLERHLQRMDKKLDKIDDRFEQMLKDQQEMNKAFLSAVQNLQTKQ